MKVNEIQSKDNTLPDSYISPIGKQRNPKPLHHLYRHINNTIQYIEQMKSEKKKKKQCTKDCFKNPGPLNFLCFCKSGSLFNEN